MGEDRGNDVRRLIDAVGERLDELVGRVHGRFVGEVPFYASLPENQVRPGIRANLERSLLALRERRAPTEEEITAAAEVAGLRAEQGIPIEAVLQGYRSALREVWQVLTEVAGSLRTESTTLLELAELLWEWADLVTMRAALVHRRVELDIARHDQQQRGNLLQSILFGSIGTAELRTHALAYGLDPERAWRPFRARALGDVTLPDLEKALLEDAAGRGEARLVAVVDGDLAGIVAKPPGTRGLPVAVGVGPPAILTTMEPSFLLASRALATAVRFRMTGTFALEDLVLRATVASEDYLGEVLLERYVRPLEAAGRFGRILLETLRVFLAEGGSVDEAAGKLSVHPNTLRHRLRRFEQLTGVELRRIETRFELWWALERRGLARHEPTHDDDSRPE